MPIDILRCSHETQSIDNTFARLFRSCDIIFIEEAASSTHNEVKKYYSDIARGSPSKHIESNFDDYSKKFEALLAGSKKQVEVELSPISDGEIIFSEDMSDRSIYFFNTGYFDNACKGYRDYLMTVQSIVRKREPGIEKQLVDLQDVDKKKRIFFPEGTNHSTFYSLKKRGLEVRQFFSKKPYTFPLSVETMRRMELGKTVNDEQIAISLAENVIANSIAPFDRVSYLEKSRKIAEVLSYSDVRDMSEYIGKDFLGILNPSSTVISWLKKKGIKAI